jgi:hypothetical protein
VPVGVQTIEHRVEKGGERAEYHDARHRHSDLPRLRADYGLGGHHGRRAADCAAGTDEYRRRRVEPEQACSDEGRHRERRDQDNRRSARESCLLGFELSCGVTETTRARLIGNRQCVRIISPDGH